MENVVLTNTEMAIIVFLAIIGIIAIIQIGVALGWLVTKLSEIDSGQDWIIEDIKKIKENMHLSHDACRLFGNASDDIKDNNDTPLWLLEEAEQRMREVNQYLNELLKRVENSNK